jgi:ferritin-like metal-binding protein YciE
MEKMNDLRDLLKHEIQDLYSVEEQIIEALPKMIEKANNTTLKNSLSEHLKITEEHKKRLDKIQQMMNKNSKEEENSNKKKGFLSGLFSGSHVCKGMKGIIEEGNKVMGEDMSPEVMDAAIIACAQKVEHYEICGYGTARTYARELGMDQLAQLLEKTLSEEYEADDRLTELAVNRVNLQAESAGSRAGDRSASGVNQRAGRGSNPERVRRAEREMEPVSSRDTSTKRTASKSSGSERSGQPKASGAAPRSSTGRGTASSKKTTSASKGSSSTSRSSGRSSASGRSSSGGRGGSGRGRK